MPRPRTNDPSNTPATPKVATCPEREQEITKEFVLRLAYLRDSYLAGARYAANDKVRFNDSLRRLRRRVEGKSRGKARGDRLHPAIEMFVSHHARQLADADYCGVEQKHVEEAARIAVASLRIRRGRPENHVLDMHVRGLMALILETTGKPVLASRYRNSVYEPHFPEGGSQLVPAFFQWVDQRISITSLVDIVVRARKEFAGRPMRFIELFPFYGARRIDGELRLRPGYRLESFEPSIPIYCP